MIQLDCGGVVGDDTVRLRGIAENDQLVWGSRKYTIRLGVGVGDEQLGCWGGWRGRYSEAVVAGTWRF